ncbi:MAG: hypothetical protein O7F72_06175 [Proteobacteria bacterium]|nr:hypothetical protein [Pseudomonadota bacterium]
MHETSDNTATQYWPSRLVAIVLCLWLTGCTSVDWLIPKSSEFNSLSGYLETMQLLSTGDPATKAEVFQQALVGARNEPSPFNRLRLALAYAAPGHPSHDPRRAKTLLSELRATPEQLTESERHLVSAQLAQVEQVIWLSGENRSLKGGVAQKQRQTRELGSVIDELQKELASAQSKLEAISNLERSFILGEGLPESGTDFAGN